MNLMLILFGKAISLISKVLNLGHGSTWPGHIALSINSNFIKEIIEKNKIKIILIAGTNGKTTTSKLIRSILEEDNKKVIQNVSGANLLNGIASTLLLNSSLTVKLDYDYAIFETDENTLPLVLKEVSPDYIVLLNLFRDQLDRYGEVNIIASKWKVALEKLTSKTTLILNADDPQIASLSLHLEGVNVEFFGLNDKNLTTSKSQHASDSTYCPKCGAKLVYKAVYFSHLGDWECKNCKLKREKLEINNFPVFPLSGVYNRYNTLAAVLFAKVEKIKQEAIIKSFENFKPAFGRQETIEISKKRAQIFLSKNPTSFNESLRTIATLNAKNILIVLNDRIPDGRDISWIWDVDFEDFSSVFKNITVSGDRIFDMGLRLKYGEFKNFEIEKNLTKAIHVAISKTPKNETLYILPTYSAMLETRKILTGKKIL